MQAWKPGARLLSDFDIKIGRLSASVRKKQLSEEDIIRACRVTDDAIARVIKPRKGHAKIIDPGGVE
ncbi:hypothetical protein [Serratia oryzae]|uniref:hypothetical protein n=1 Tax=Serratia oryzae TaxID=2034155 RepID=UPI001F4F6DC8|nr:hypothetical protein [Serratia oryzae]